MPPRAGVRTYWRATPRRKERFGVPDARARRVVGMRRWRQFRSGVRSPGRGVPAPPRPQLGSEVPLPQDLLSLAVCAEAAEGGGLIDGRARRALQ